MKGIYTNKDIYQFDNVLTENLESITIIYMKEVKKLFNKKTLNGKFVKE